MKKYIVIHFDSLYGSIDKRQEIEGTSLRQVFDDLTKGEIDFEEQEYQGQINMDMGVLDWNFEDIRMTIVELN